MMHWNDRFLYDDGKNVAEVVLGAIHCYAFVYGHNPRIEGEGFISELFETPEEAQAWAVATYRINRRINNGHESTVTR